MLSHHEFATLVLVSGNADATALDRADVEALLAHRLIAFEHVDPHHSKPRVTTQGSAFLLAVRRVRASDCIEDRSSQ